MRKLRHPVERYSKFNGYQDILDGMHKNSMSQARLAKEVGISTSSICDIVNGRRIPSEKHLLAIAEALNINLDTWKENSTDVRRILAGYSNSSDGLDALNEFNRKSQEMQDIYCIMESRYLEEIQELRQQNETLLEKNGELQGALGDALYYLKLIKAELSEYQSTNAISSVEIVSSVKSDIRKGLKKLSKWEHLDKSILPTGEEMREHIRGVYFARRK